VGRDKLDLKYDFFGCGLSDESICYVHPRSEAGASLSGELNEHEEGDQKGEQNRIADVDEQTEQEVVRVAIGLKQ